MIAGVLVNISKLQHKYPLSQALRCVTWFDHTPKHLQVQKNQQSLRNYQETDERKLTLDSLTPSDHKIEKGSKEGKENDDQNPHDLVIALKLIHQDTDQCQDGQQYDEQNEQQDRENTRTGQEKKSHGKSLLVTL